MAASPSPGCTVYSVPTAADGVGAGVGSGDGDPSEGGTLGEGAAEGGGAELDGVAEGSVPPQAESSRAAARRVGPRRAVRIGQLGW
jgi:hypothetical protein